MEFNNRELRLKISDLQQKVDNVLKYIEENPYSDPNAYEMNELLYEMSNIKNEGWEIYGYDFFKDSQMSKLYQDYSKMMNSRMEQLVYPDTGLCESKNDTLYKYFEQGIHNSTGKLGNEEAKKVNSKACGINLYVKQVIRDLKKSGQESIIYNNGQELNNLLTKMSDEDIEYYTHPAIDTDDIIRDAMLAFNRTPSEFEQAKIDFSEKTNQQLSLDTRIKVTQQSIDNVLKFIEENPYSDPNAYEMNELLYNVSNLKNESWKLYGYDYLNNPPMSRLIHDFSKMMNARMEQLVIPDVGLCDSKNDPLYKYFEENMKNSTAAIGNNKAQEISSKVCGINLYIKQRIRDLDMDGKEEVIYDNFEEFNALLDKIDEYNKDEKIKFYSSPVVNITDLIKESKLALGKTPKEFAQAKELAKKDEIKRKAQDPNIG